jgi:uncharacterized membrane protein YhaH (DUF805 family)
MIDNYITPCIKKSFDFTGKASVKEFWYTQLQYLGVFILVVFGGITVDALLGFIFSYDTSNSKSFLQIIINWALNLFTFVFHLSSLALVKRRLNSIGCQSPIALILLTPYILMSFSLLFRRNIEPDIGYIGAYLASLLILVFLFLPENCSLFDKAKEDKLACNKEDLLKNKKPEADACDKKKDITSTVIDKISSLIAHYKG